VPRQFSLTNISKYQKTKGSYRVGIRFHCHHCEYELHVKDFQAGKRGKCPECQGKFRIPLSDAPHSFPVDQADTPVSVPEPVVPVPQAESQPAPMPKPLLEVPAATWYVRPSSGGQFGPATNDVFHQWLEESRVGAESLVWRDDWPEWQSAEQVFPDYFAVSGTGAPQPTYSSQALPTSQNFSNRTTTTNTATIESPAIEIPSSQSAGERNRISRRQRRKRNYLLMISGLVVAALALTSALIFVLLNQSP
jgi:hypothetical protein